jgi:N-acetyl-anhydromuramyl-L-alanine amidase AmpD
MYFVAHIYKDKYMVQDFMSLLKENKMMSIHFMVLKMEACISIVNQDQAFEAGFSNEG